MSAETPSPGHTISIPGKVMLSGEYAVLYGGTAALLHAPRRLHLTPAEQGPAPDYPPAAREARRYRINMLADFEQEHGLPHFTLDASGFFTEAVAGTSVKLGLGLSAAEAVGAIALRFQAAGYAWTDHRSEVAAHALLAHRLAQGGSGSGADVVACASAGPVLCALRDEQLHATPLAPETRPVLPLALYFSGEAADTRQLVPIFQRWVAGDKPDAIDDAAVDSGDDTPAPPGDPATLLAELVAASDALAPAWFSAPPAELLLLVDRFDHAMQLCAAAAGLPYALPVHARLSAWARRHGGRAKPTGAGGGDMVLLIGELPLSQLQGLVLPL